jgi:hypothetical protein
MDIAVRCRPKCYPALAVAITEFCEACNSNAADTRERVIFARLRRTVDEVLSVYRSDLISRGHHRSRCSFLHLSRYLHLFGRQRTESRLLQIHRLLRIQRQVHSRPFLVHSQRKFVQNRLLNNRAKAPATTASDLAEALDTIDTLRSFVNAIASLRPKASFVHGANIRTPHWEAMCRYCDQPTELQAFRDGDLTLVEGCDSRRTLNPKLCHKHRSRDEDGSSSHVYRRMLRNDSIVQRELQELTWASVRKGAHESSREALMLYAFRRKVVDARNLYLDDKVELANEARALVEHGVTDRKKILIMLLSIKLDRNRIAAELGVSRQAVYKAIGALPDAYRFDLSDDVLPHPIKLQPRAVR